MSSQTVRKVHMYAARVVLVVLGYSFMVSFGLTLGADLHDALVVPLALFASGLMVVLAIFGLTILVEIAIDGTFKRAAESPSVPAEPCAVDAAVIASFGMDAKKWAGFFCQLMRVQPEIASDEETMLGWFANAIMAGYDEARRRYDPNWPPTAEPPAPQPADISREQDDEQCQSWSNPVSRYNEVLQCVMPLNHDGLHVSAHNGIVYQWAEQGEERAKCARCGHDRTQHLRQIGGCTRWYDHKQVHCDCSSFSPRLPAPPTPAETARRNVVAAMLAWLDDAVELGTYTASRRPSCHKFSAAFDAAVHAIRAAKQETEP